LRSTCDEPLEVVDGQLAVLESIFKPALVRVGVVLVEQKLGLH